MSRGLQTAIEDEKVGNWVVGQAINYAVLTKMHQDPTLSYESVRNAIAENMALWIEEQFIKSRFW